MTRTSALRAFHDFFAGGTVEFSGYDKFVFSWIATQGPYVMRVDYGGSADDIYKFNFNGRPWRIKSTIEVMNEAGYSVSIHDKEELSFSYRFSAD